MNATTSPPNALLQLEQARKYALRDAAHYPQILNGILPMIGKGASLELRRWGADFLAETFASPRLAPAEKETLSVSALDTLKAFLDSPSEDSAVVRSAVQAVTSVYPLIFRYTIYHPNDPATWPKMAAIKQSILRGMDLAPESIKVCCIKFIQRVVQVQTPGMIADPRRSEQNEISLALVSREHPLLSPAKLEAEALGLLDRLLSVFQDANSDALLVNATLNSVGTLVRTRASIAHKILNAILGFSPFRVTGSSITSKTKVLFRSMEKTLRSFLLNFNKRNPQHPLAGRVQGYLDRLQQQRSEVLEEVGRKRPAQTEPTDGLDQHKRQRLLNEVSGTPPQNAVTPLPPGPTSVAQLFTLTQDEGLKGFDVQSVPIELVNRINVSLLSSINQAHLDNAVNAVRSRYLSLSQPAPGSVATAGALALGEDAEDYTPAEDAENVLNRLDGGSLDAFALTPQVALAPFVIPQPNSLRTEELEEYSKTTAARIFGIANSLNEATGKIVKSAFNWVAAQDHDRESWVIGVSRMATRAHAGLEKGSRQISELDEHGRTVTREIFSIENAIREALRTYVLEDFRRRIDVAISWLSEEWSVACIQKPHERNGEDMYSVWSIKVLDGMIPFLDAKDKVLIRFLSEIPAVGSSMIDRVKHLAIDPERVTLAVQTLHYLALFRPPARDMAVDALEDLWRNYDDAKAPAGKLLQRWRPQVLQIQGSTSEGKSSASPPASATTAAAA